jgi:hypothetical protein
MKRFDIFKDAYGVFWIISEITAKRVMCRRINAKISHLRSMRPSQVINLYTTPAGVEVDAIVTIRDKKETYRLVEVDHDAGYVVAQVVNSNLVMSGSIFDVSITKYKLKQ